MKRFDIRLAGSTLYIERVTRAKTTQLSYEVGAIQVFAQTARGRGEEGEIPSKPAFCLSIVQTRNCIRKIYFEDEGAMRHWQELILDRQGYLESRLDAYELLKVVGQGSFGTVRLARHKNSQQ